MRKQYSLVAATLGLLFGASAPRLPGQNTNVPPSDAAIYRKISLLRERAAAIKIDGKADDWEGFPTHDDPEGDANGDDSRDLVRTAFVAREDDMLIALSTKGKPSKESLAFGFALNLSTMQHAGDVEIELNGPGGQHLRKSHGAYLPVSGIEVAIDDIVEIRVPYSALASRLPANLRPLLTDSRTRPWVRITPFSFSQATRAVDYGASAASYRLLATRYPLDSPLRRPENPTASIELPFAGKWYLGQGAFYEGGSHSTGRAYDFYILDHTFFPARVRQNPQLQDYYSWGQRVYAPMAGSVVLARSDVADPPPFYQGNLPVGAFNRVSLDCGNGLGLDLVHFQQRAVNVAVGSRVTRGTLLGLVGNSGNASWPHLHFALGRLPADHIGQPIAFANIRVSLNATTNDFWSRDLALWEPREGYFVERLR